MSDNNSSRQINTIVIGSNMILLIAYTLYLKFQTGEEFIVADAFFIFLQIILCVIFAAFNVKFRKAFLMSALLVLLIGFSTCYIGS